MRKVEKVNTPILKSLVNEAPLNEWPWSKKTPAEAPAEPEDNTPEVELKTLDVFAGKLIQAAPNTTRLVLRLTSGNIRQYYFDKAGPTNFVTALSDEQVLEFIANPTKSLSKKADAEIQLMPKNFKFSSQLRTVGSANYCVLIDTPLTIVQKINTAKSAGESGVNEARAALIEALNHKFYVMTLSIPASKKIAEQIDAAGSDLDEIANALVPGMLVAMPKSGEVKVVRDAIIEHKDGAAPQSTSSDNSDEEENTDDEGESKKSETTQVAPSSASQQFKNLLNTLNDSDPKTFNKLTQLLADIGQAPDKKKKMAEISRLLGDE